MSVEKIAQPDVRSRIIEVAARLLLEHGPSAVTTRGVAQEAGVQAPRIYRLFGDKEGLLDAVAEHVMADFVSAKASRVEKAAAGGVDPLEDLRAGWQEQVDFGVANAALFRLLGDPARVRTSTAAEAGRRVLESRVRRVAETGRLRVTETRAVELMMSAGAGVIQTLLATPPERRTPGLPEDMYEAVLRQILTVETDGTTAESSIRTDSKVPRDGASSRTDPVATAVAFRANLARLRAVSEAERRFLSEWLDRIAVEEMSPTIEPTPVHPR